MLFSLNGIETTDFFEFREWSNLTFPLHCHYSFEVVCMLSGSAYFQVESKSYTLSASEVLVVMPFEKHSVVTDEHSSSKMIAFQISPQLISNFDLCFSERKFQNPVCRFQEDDITEIYNLLKNTDANPIEINYIFFKIMNKFRTNSVFAPHSHPDNVCQEALSYISSNFTNQLTLKSVSEAIGVSSVYLSRVFAKKIKFKFVDCINSFRVQKAISLFANPQKRISEICYECGFGSLRQFNRIFMEQFGCTPSQYRKNIVIE